MSQCCLGPWLKLHGQKQFFCVLEKKERHTGLEQHYFAVNFSIKIEIIKVLNKVTKEKVHSSLVMMGRALCYLSLICHCVTVETLSVAYWRILSGWWPSSKVPLCFSWRNSYYRFPPGDPGQSLLYIFAFSPALSIFHPSLAFACDPLCLWKSSPEWRDEREWFHSSLW